MSEIRCPACRALVRSAACGRCGADLTDVIRAVSWASRLTEEARMIFLRGDFDTSAALARAAWMLRKTDAARSVWILALLAQGRGADALKLWVEKNTSP